MKNLCQVFVHDIKQDPMLC